MRKFWKPVDADTNGIYAFGPVPEPGRCRYQSNLASEPEILGNATGICAEVVPNPLKEAILRELNKAIYDELVEQGILAVWPDRRHFVLARPTLNLSFEAPSMSFF